MNRAERRRQRKKGAKKPRQSGPSSLAPEKLHQIDVLLAQAYKAMQVSEEEKTEALCDQVLVLQRDNFDAWLLKGVIARRNKDIDTAITYFEKAISINPDRPDGYSNLGNALRDRGDLAQAADRYQESLDKNPDQIAALNNLSVVKRGLGEFERALELAKRALELNPKFREAHINIGAALACLERYEEALPHFELAQPSDPSYLSIPSAIANCLFQLREFDKAAAWIATRATGPWEYLQSVYGGDAFQTALNADPPSERLKARIQYAEIPKPSSEQPVLYISGDTNYLDRYLKPFCTSFCKAGNAGRIHLHALVRDAKEVQKICDQLEPFDAIEASLSYEDLGESEARRVYYSTIRFAVISVLYEEGHLSGPVFAVDIDSTVRADLSSVWAYFEDHQASVGLFERKTEFIEQQIAAGALYLAGDTISRGFIKDVGAYICHSLMDRSPHWYLDQIALFMTRLHYQDTGRARHFIGVPPRFLDWKNTPEGLIWTDKGKKDT